MELRQLVNLKAASLVSTISTISLASTVCDHFGPFLDTMDTKAFFRPAENAALSPKHFALSEGHLVSIWCQPPRNGNRPVSAPTTSGTSSVIDPTYCYDGNPGDDTYMGGSGPGGHTSQALYHSWPSLTTTAAATLNIQASTLAYGTGCLATIQASLNGGSTGTTLFSETGALVQANYTLSVPSGQNLALVQVQANCSGSSTLTGYIDLYFNSLYIE